MSSFLQQQPIILASGSSIRAKLLNSLGLHFLVVPSNCDEDKLKAQHGHEDKIRLGMTLARHKAMEVSERYPQHYIIAADQLCVVNDTLLDKPLNHETAVNHLNLLSGKEHLQIACLCIVKQNTLLWEYSESATVSLHDLDRDTIERYLQEEKPYQSCGAYQFETLGKWLFKTVRGNEDTILGLPLIPLANALLTLGAVTY
ncbi:Maf family protein [Legionella waltersii]|uniref:Nucleoside triphosphate pyrophosphatase n=1 Tax=Legionella waltersii TaxID=66969 RepID=A0A0W1AMR6_9GAMM|nr:Maf family nucleotide pyrophosphatase [Legionella waltersii]KTD82634.1 Maf-like protein [Legionella waltersii]SNV07993.1 septum formation protein [Legionella waltersii]